MSLCAVVGLGWISLRSGHILKEILGFECTCFDWILCVGQGVMRYQRYTYKRLYG